MASKADKMSETHAFKHERRSKRTDRQLARIFLERGGKCHVCKRKLYPGDEYQFDHIVALENGGSDADDNLAPCCSWCHKPKTANDAGVAAKIRAVAVANIIPAAQRQKKGRPIPGSKRSGWKHLMSGQWVRR